MEWFSRIVEGLASFVRRNPIFVLVVIVLAVAAPSVLAGAFKILLYIVLFLLLLFVGSLLVFRWRIRQMRQEAERTFSSGAAGHASSRSSRRRTREGEVRIEQQAPSKRVRGDVGDYVDFEEIPDEPHTNP